MKNSVRSLCPFLILLFVFFPLNASALNNDTVYGCAAPPPPKAKDNSLEILVLLGDARLDSAIYEDLEQLSLLFNVSVPIYFPKTDSKVAYFDTSKYPELMKKDGVDPNTPITGSVFISTGFLENEFAENYGSEMSVPAIIAHEFSHALQYQMNSPFPKGIKRELQADFLAGWYVAHRCACMKPQDAGVAFRSFYNKGNLMDFFDPNNHGTKEQRLDAMQRGFDFRMRNFGPKEAYYYSLELYQNLRG